MGSKGDVIPEQGTVIIGNNNTIREFVNFNFPVRRPTSQLGNHNYIMARSYLPHDCQIANHVVVADNALMGGGCVLSDYSYMGLGSIMHQWLDLGESAILGLQAGVKEHVAPFCVVVGVPGRILKFNRVGAERRGFLKDEIDEVDAHFANIISGVYSSKNVIVNAIHSFIHQHNDKVLRKFV
jgi:UDP-N-acetylglucosamine acyltransferase